MAGIYWKEITGISSKAVKKDRECKSGLVKRQEARSKIEELAECRRIARDLGIPVSELIQSI